MNLLWGNNQRYKQLFNKGVIDRIIYKEEKQLRGVTAEILNTNMMK